MPTDDAERASASADARDRIRARIAATGHTVPSAAALAGLTPRAVRRYLAGGELAPGQVLALAESLGMAVVVRVLDPGPLDPTAVKLRRQPGRKKGSGGA